MEPELVIYQLHFVGHLMAAYFIRLVEVCCLYLGCGMERPSGPHFHLGFIALYGLIGGSQKDLSKSVK